mmetsp:Transcript_24454/g.76725  ORF Transcript_24454/g.76725 Transcript_24454/m.76725 type:complete len:498 (+) Transcript_24454:184-1677(+)
MAGVCSPTATATTATSASLANRNSLRSASRTAAGSVPAESAAAARNRTADRVPASARRLAGGAVSGAETELSPSRKRAGRGSPAWSAGGSLFGAGPGLFAEAVRGERLGSRRLGASAAAAAFAAAASAAAFASKAAASAAATISATAASAFVFASAAAVAAAALPAASLPVDAASLPVTLLHVDVGRRDGARHRKLQRGAPRPPCQRLSVVAPGAQHPRQHRQRHDGLQPDPHLGIRLLYQVLDQRAALQRCVGLPRRLPGGAGVRRPGLLRLLVRVHALGQLLYLHWPQRAVLPHCGDRCAADMEHGLALCDPRQRGLPLHILRCRPAVGRLCRLARAQAHCHRPDGRYAVHSRHAHGQGPVQRRLWQGHVRVPYRHWLLRLEVAGLLHRRHRHGPAPVTGRPGLHSQLPAPDQAHDGRHQQPQLGHGPGRTHLSVVQLRSQRGVQAGQLRHPDACCVRLPLRRHLVHHLLLGQADLMFAGGRGPRPPRRTHRQFV